MSAPKRFFIEKQGCEKGERVELSGEEFIHARSVLRLTEGSEITLLDNTGNEYSAVVEEIGKHSLFAHITGVNVGDREAKSKIYLLVGALKGDKTELVVQKATELGVYKIGVFSSQFCSAYMNENKLERLNKVAREAAKQCYRSVAPEVAYFDNLCDALDSAEEYSEKLFFCEFASSSDRDFSKIKDSVALVVGSEGGFSDGEFKEALSRGYAGMSLGKRILRAETAAISVCAVAAFCLKELQ